MLNVVYEGHLLPLVRRISKLELGDEGSGTAPKDINFDVVPPSLKNIFLI